MTISSCVQNAGNRRKNPIPANFSVELRERLISRGKGSLLEKEKASLKLVLSFTNTGNRPINSLVFQARVMDKSGDPLPIVHSSMATNFEKFGLLSRPPGSFTAVYGSEPIFLPGERRIVQATVLIPDADPDDLGKYEISILTIE